MRILVVGPARSGTSWVTATLGTTPGAAFLLEPDNPGQYPFAAVASFGMGFVAGLGPDEPGHRACGVSRTSRSVLRSATYPVSSGLPSGCTATATQKNGQRAMRIEDPKMSLRLRVAAALAVPRNLPPDTRHRVVKSIRAAHMVEWIVANWQPAVVVCRRHPLDVVASRMEMTDQPPIGVRHDRSSATRPRRRYGVEIPAANDEVAVLAWRVGVQMSALHELLAREPAVSRGRSRGAVRRSGRRFRGLAGALGIEWTAENEAVLVASNRPGTGYELNRVQANLPGAWRRRSVARGRAHRRGMIAQLPIAERYDLDVSKTPSADRLRAQRHVRLRRSAGTVGVLVGGHRLCTHRGAGRLRATERTRPPRRATPALLQGARTEDGEEPDARRSRRPATWNGDHAPRRPRVRPRSIAARATAPGGS